MSAFTPIEPYIAEPMARSNHGLQPADCYFQVALSDSKVALSQVMDRLLSLALASIGYFQVALSVCVVTVLSQVIIALPRSRSARESRLFPGGAVEFGGRRIPGHRGAPCCDCLDAVWLLPGRAIEFGDRAVPGHRFSPLLTRCRYGDGYFQVALSNSLMVASHVIAALLLIAVSAVW